MILHTVNKNFPHSDCLQQCLRLCAANDALLLMEDGVYAAIKSCVAWQLIKNSSTANIYALATDIKARGLTDQCAAGIQLIDTEEFVALCCQYDTVQSWY